MLRREQASAAENILIHRIAGQQQLGGVDPTDAPLSFLDFVGGRPMAGYHAPIAARMIERARQYVGVDLGLKWLGLAAIALALQSGGGYESGPPEEVKNSTRLDGWLGRHPIRIAASLCRQRPPPGRRARQTGGRVSVAEVTTITIIYLRNLKSAS